MLFRSENSFIDEKRQLLLPARRTFGGDAGRVTANLKSDLSGRSQRRSLKTDRVRHGEFKLLRFHQFIFL